jgi:hypothetical protein
MIKKIKKKILNESRLFFLKIRHFSYNSSLNFSNREAKSIIFCVNGWGYHGGWTDRLKGLISTYDFAISNGYAFKIWYDFPCELNEILSPNYNWTCKNIDKEYNPFKDRIFYFIDRKDDPLQNQKKLSNRKNFIYYNVDNIKNQLKWKKNYDELFLGNLKIQLLVKKKLTVNKKNIAFVFRFLNHLGDFKLDRRRGLSEKRKEALIKSYIYKVNEYIGKNLAGTETVIYVFSDSDLFIKSIISEIPYLKNINSVDRNFIHYNNQSTQKAKQTLERTFTDFIFLGLCSEIHHFVDNKYLYPSGFPKYASIVGNDNIYKMININK